MIGLTEHEFNGRNNKTYKAKAETEEAGLDEAISVEAHWKNLVKDVVPVLFPPFSNMRWLNMLRDIF